MVERGDGCTFAQIQYSGSSRSVRFTLAQILAAVRAVSQLSLTEVNASPASLSKGGVSCSSYFIWTRWLRIRWTVEAWQRESGFVIVSRQQWNHCLSTAVKTEWSEDSLQFMWEQLDWTEASVTLCSSSDTLHLAIDIVLDVFWTSWSWTETLDDSGHVRFSDGGQHSALIGHIGHVPASASSLAQIATFTPSDVSFYWSAYSCTPDMSYTSELEERKSERISFSHLEVLMC